MAKSSAAGSKKRPLKQAKKRRQSPLKASAARQGSRAGRIAFGILVGLAVLALAFFIWARTQSELSVPENAVGTLVTPVQDTASFAATWIRDRIQEFRDRRQLRADYEEAQLRIMQLEYRVSQLEENEAENSRLRALLDAQARYTELSPIYARVIARESGRWFNVFSINRGTLSGVTAGMAVINADGLVGRVYEAGLNYAKVISIIDSRSAVACLIQRTRDNGVMRGRQDASSTDDGCNMYYVPSVNDIVPQDEVITSGLDGLFPKGLRVGVVREVSRQSDVSDQYVVVSPAADFQRLEDVLVLQTVIETDRGEALSPLPSPTTRARPTELPDGTPIPGSVGAPEPTLAPNDWAYPTATPDLSATTAPIEGARPEEEWASQ